jgi:Domain of unknown function (DUF4381)
MNPTIDFSQLPLRDIHLPGAISWWPPAPGWWLLLAVALVGVALYGVQYFRGRHRRTALRGLQRVKLALEQGAEPVGCLQSVSTLLRRFAMTTAINPSAAPVDVPGLIGDRWLDYLDSRWQRDAFARGAGRRLLAAPYARPNSIARTDALELTTLCSEWLMAQPVTNTARSARRG